MGEIPESISGMPLNRETLAGLIEEEIQMVRNAQDGIARQENKKCLGRLLARYAPEIAAALRGKPEGLGIEMLFTLPQVDLIVYADGVALESARAKIAASGDKPGTAVFLEKDEFEAVMKAGVF